MDVTNAVDDSRIGTADAEQLQYATSQGRVLFTYNVGDFAALHKEIVTQGMGHSEIIVAPQQRYSMGEQMRRVLKMQSALGPAEMTNRFEYLSSWG